MSSEATVFSKHYHISFVNPLHTREVENLLQEFIVTVGHSFSQDNVILGHIKLLGRLSELAVEHFLFLSLTRLDQVNVIPSKCWSHVNGITLTGLDLDINVLIFGYTFSEIETKVTEALNQLGDYR